MFQAHDHILYIYVYIENIFIKFNDELAGRLSNTCKTGGMTIYRMSLFYFHVSL